MDIGKELVEVAKWLEENGFGYTEERLFFAKEMEEITAKKIRKRCRSDSMNAEKGARQVKRANGPENAHTAQD